MGEKWPWWRVFNFAELLEIGREDRRINGGKVTLVHIMSWTLRNFLNFAELLEIGREDRRINGGKVTLVHIMSVARLQNRENILEDRFELPRPVIICEK